jgi:hypothetical protein
MSKTLLEQVQTHVNDRLHDNVCPICLEKIQQSTSGIVFFNCSCNYFYHISCACKLHTCPICRTRTNKLRLTKTSITPLAVSMYRRLKQYYEQSNNANNPTYINIIRTLINKYHYKSSTVKLSCDIEVLFINTYTRFKYNYNIVDQIPPSTRLLCNQKHTHLTKHVTSLVSWFNKYTYGMIDLINSLCLSNIYCYGSRLMLIKLYSMTELSSIEKYINNVPLDIRIHGTIEKYMKTVDTLIRKIREIYEEHNVFFINNNSHITIYIDVLKMYIRIESHMYETVNQLHMSQLNSLNKIFVRPYNYKCYSLPDFNVCFYQLRPVYISSFTDCVDEQLLENVCINSMIGYETHISSDMYNKLKLYNVKIDHNDEINKMYNILNKSIKPTDTHIINPHKIYCDKLNMKSMYVNNTHDLVMFIENVNLSNVYGLNSSIKKCNVYDGIKIFSNLNSYVCEIDTDIGVIDRYERFRLFLNISFSRFNRHKYFEFVDQFTYDFTTHTLKLIVYTEKHIDLNNDIGNIDTCDIHPCILKLKNENVTGEATIMYFL